MKKRIYEYKGKRYKFITDTVRKCPITREWIGVVIYESMEDGNTYVRDGEDFYIKFNEIYCFNMPDLKK